ncbi:MAG: hypothetical protein HQL46_15120 [Gammaproteobacteria bacterium]|nr:hypothetical protein [Gammaproteobacteria bacterium]
MFQHIFLAIVLILSFSSSYASFDYNKYLKSETRAQVKLQKLVEDAGDYPEAVKFGKMGYKKYNSNIFIMSYYAKAMYLNGDLDNSKIIFMKVLSKEPSNDIASEFIKKIEEQEAAKTNKDLEETLGYLSDKGLDFLMIFLGFLGAEVLAKRYAKCMSSDSKKNIDAYIWLEKHKSGIHLFIIKYYFKEIYNKPICFVLQIIILLTIAAAITLVINWFELMGYLNWLQPIFFSQEQLEVVKGDDLWINFLWTALIVFIFMISINLWKALKESEKNIIDVANELQTIALENDFELLQECVERLLKNNVNFEKVIKYCINEEARGIIQKLKKLYDDGAYSV